MLCLIHKPGIVDQEMPPSESRLQMLSRTIRSCVKWRRVQRALLFEAAKGLDFTEVEAQYSLRDLYGMMMSGRETPGRLE
jgi:hypothetical protein